MRLRFATFVVALIFSTGLGRGARAQYCYPVIVGYAHPFDIQNVPQCNVFNQCWTVAVQVPCQHPIFRQVCQ